MKWYQLISPISPPSISCSTGQVLFISHFIKHSCPNTACARLGDVALTASLFSKACPSSSPDAPLLLCSASSKARAEAINNFCLGVCVSHFMLCGFFFFFLISMYVSSTGAGILSGQEQFYSASLIPNASSRASVIGKQALAF